MIRYAYYETRLGLIRIGCSEGAIVSLSRWDRLGDDHCPTPLSDRAAAELKEYLAGSRTVFDLPLAPTGTSFQRRVWDALLQIPFGETRSYRDIARAIGNPAACRAVGAACGKNPIWVLIPCHRVLGSSQALTGIAGGIQMKQALLELEGHRF